MLVQVARYSAWSGSLTTASLVTLRSGVIPFDRLPVVRSSLWRHPYIQDTGRPPAQTQEESVAGPQYTGAELRRLECAAAGIPRD